MTRKGTVCKRRRLPGSQCCAVHQPQPKSPTRALAVIGEGSTADGPGTLLRDTLRRAGFWKCIEARRAACGVAKADLRVVIQPDLHMFDVSTPTGTDPQLVEKLIQLLHQRGYRDVAVVDGAAGSSLWLENRDVPVLADLVGYRYTTDTGRDYDVINLSEDPVEAAFPEHSVLAGSALGRAWLEAHVRISFAKNKTDEEHGFSLGLQNLLGVLPLRDKDYHYRHRLDTGDVILELLRHTPVHFSLIDAVISNHGSAGSHGVNPLRTNTVIAGQDIVLTDWTAALKMGADPYASPLTARVLRDVGLPPNYRMEGDLEPYAGWRNVSPLTLDSVRKRCRSVTTRQIVRPWLQTVNRDLFPFKNMADDRINQLVTDFLHGSDSHPAADIVRIGVNYLLAAAGYLGEAYQTMFDKDQLLRRQRALGLTLGDFALTDYEAIVDYMEPLADIAAKTPPDRNGLRWRYIDNSVLFEFRRVLPIAYDRFTARVDISAAVRMMNDNIGGAHVPVVSDSAGRITHQAERDIYLPQPNWMVLFGGDVIDVGKLEFIRYEKNRHQIFWRTVASTNDSATFDDGIVTFSRRGREMTEVTIVARQQFALPLFWQVINMDLVPQIKDELVSNAYTTFFSRTMANVEAAAEGRETRAGQRWDERMGEGDAGSAGIPTAAVTDLLAKILSSAQPVWALLNNVRQRPAEPAAGPEPVPGTSPPPPDTAGPVAEFLQGLAEAVRKDLRSVASPYGAETPE